MAKIVINPEYKCDIFPKIENSIIDKNITNLIKAFNFCTSVILLLGHK